MCFGSESCMQEVGWEGSFCENEDSTLGQEQVELGCTQTGGRCQAPEMLWSWVALKNFSVLLQCTVSHWIAGCHPGKGTHVQSRPCNWGQIPERTVSPRQLVSHSWENANLESQKECRARQRSIRQQTTSCPALIAALYFLFRLF